MFKYNTVKFALISVLSASAFQVVAEDFPTAENSAVYAGGQQSNWVDFSDPTAIFSKVGLGTGTEGVDVYGALGGYLGGQFEQKLTIEGKHDMDFFNINYLAFNTANDTGFTLDTRWDSDYNQIAAGVVKKLYFDQNQNVVVYPAMKFGGMWDWDNDFESTSFVQIDLTLRYVFNRNFWVGATPTYKYALGGEDINDWDGTIDAGYQLAEEIAASIHANNDDEVWADFTFAF